MPRISITAAAVWLAVVAGQAPASAQEGAGTRTGEGEATIAERLAEDPRFAALAEAIDEAGLVKLLDSKGPYTLFAPTDEAFEASEDELPGGDVEELGALIKRHVVVGPVERTDGAEGEVMVKTLSGDRIAVDFATEPMTVGGGARVIEGGIAASNGVIHAVDRVLTKGED